MKKLVVILFVFLLITTLSTFFCAQADVLKLTNDTMIPKLRIINIATLFFIFLSPFLISSFGSELIKLAYVVRILLYLHQLTFRFIDHRFERYWVSKLYLSGKQLKRV